MGICQKSMKMNIAQICYSQCEEFKEIARPPFCRKIDGIFEYAQTGDRLNKHADAKHKASF
jgi:hypothetical protein